MKRYALYLMIMVLLGAPAGAWGQEDFAGETADPGAPYTAMDEGSEEMQDEAAEPPTHYALEPLIEVWAGFRYVSVDGSRRALEYGWPYPSPTGGILLHYTPLPSRIDFELSMKNHNDYNAEVGYAYRDIFKLDYRGWALYHNLDHFKPQPGPTDRNPDAEYHVTARDNRIFLRLKWPDRAYHLFGEVRQFEKDGTIQQRTDAGGRVAKSRDIDWITRRYTAGINGHLGPVEIEYSHRIKTFNPHKEVAPMDSFFGGTYVHSAVPELESSSENVKMHTALTGRIVGSATFVNGRKKNNNTQARVDYNRVFTDLVLIPVEHVTVAFRYRYKDLKTESPWAINDPLRGVIATEDPIDSKSHQASVTVRYTPMNSLGMKLEYVFNKIEKNGARDWSEALGPGGFRIFPFQELPTDQNMHTVKLGANVRPLRNLDAKGSVEYTYTQDPAYPVKPVNSFKGRFDVDWMPHYTVNIDTYYRFAREYNNTANMKLAKDNAGTLISWVPVERLSCYLNYDYMRLRNERDIRLVAGTDALSFALLPVDRVPYRDTSHFYAVGMGYGFAFPLSVNAEFHQNWTAGKYRTSAAAWVGKTSDLKIRETGGTFRASYDFPKGWGTSAEYSVNDYQDLLDKPQNGTQDGLAQAIMVMVKKEW